MVTGQGYNPAKVRIDERSLLADSVPVDPGISDATGYGLNWRNQVEMPSGGFTSILTYLRAVYAFSTRLTTHAPVQYNQLENTFSSNVRPNFIHRPGSDLFVVITEERGGTGSERTSCGPSSSSSQPVQYSRSTSSPSYGH